jgi:hypothetical protein
VLIKIATSNNGIVITSICLDPARNTRVGTDKHQIKYAFPKHNDHHVISLVVFIPPFDVGGGVWSEATAAATTSSFKGN